MLTAGRSERPSEIVIAPPGTRDMVAHGAPPGKRRAGVPERRMRKAATRGATLALWMAVVVGLVAGCANEERPAVALRRFPAPYRAAVAVADERAPGAPVAVLFDGRLSVVPGPRVGTVGQDAPCSLIDRARQFWACVLGYFRTGRWPSAVHFGNRLLDPGPEGHHCKLFASSWPGRAGSFAEALDRLLTDRVLLELEAKGGYMVAVPPGPTADSAGTNGIGPEGRLSALRARIARVGRTGRIIAVDPDRLLAWRIAESSLVWSCEEGPDRIEIRIESIEDDVIGSIEPNAADLAGVTFYTPMPGSTVVLLRGQVIDGISLNPPDHTRTPSVTIGNGAGSGPAPGPVPSRGVVSRSDTAP